MIFFDAGQMPQLELQSIEIRSSVEDGKIVLSTVTECLPRNSTVTLSYLKKQPANDHLGNRYPEDVAALEFLNKRHGATGRALAESF